MKSIKSVRMLDQELQAQLVESLTAMLTSCQTKPPVPTHIDVTLCATARDANGGEDGGEGETGGGEDELLVSYAQPTKEWLCAYRLEVCIALNMSPTYRRHIAGISPIGRTHPVRSTV